VGKLDEICREIGVTKLSEFVDSSEITQDFDLDIPAVVSDPVDLIQTLKGIYHYLSGSNSYNEEVKNLLFG